MVTDMTVKTDLYDEAEVADYTDWHYQIKVVDGNDVALEWIDQVKCEIIRK